MGAPHWSWEIDCLKETIGEWRPSHRCDRRVLGPDVPSLLAHVGGQGANGIGGSNTHVLVSQM